MRGQFQLGPIMPLASVVIPTTLNPARQEFIRAAVESALAQKDVDLEVLVVHNGTPQERGELLGEHLASVRYVYTARGSVGHARNLGVQLAQGRYVAFLDDDDLWSPEKMAMQVRSLEENRDLDVVFTDTELFDEHGTRHPSYISFVGGVERLPQERRENDLVVQAASWFRYLIRSCPFLPSCWAGRRDVLLSMPFADILSEDRELLWRLSRAHQLGFVDRVLVRKRDHETNLSLDTEACIAGIIVAFRNAETWRMTREERSLLRSFAAEAHFELGFGCRRRGEHLMALKHQLSSLYLVPRLEPLLETMKNILLLRGRR